LLPEFTAIENVMMPCLVAGLIRSLSKEKAFNMLKELGLENRTEHKVGQLSGGEQQRVAIARAMVMGPKLLLADEPTGNLDENTGRMVTGQFLSLNKLYGTTMVVVTHNLSLASRMDRCLGLMEGKAVELMASDLKAFGVGRS
jgi:lipoprotein-releasing system ATP-binding protein